MPRKAANLRIPMAVIDDDTLCTDQFYVWSKIELMSLRQRNDVVNLGVKLAGLARITGMRRPKLGKIIGEFRAKGWAQMSEDNQLTIFVGRETGSLPQVKEPIPEPKPIPIPIPEDITSDEVSGGPSKEGEGVEKQKKSYFHAPVKVQKPPRTRPVPPPDPICDKWLDEFRDWYVREAVPLGCPPCNTLTDEFRIKGRGAFYQTRKLETEPLRADHWKGLKKGLQTYPPNFLLNFNFGWFLKKDHGTDQWNADKIYLRGKAKPVNAGSGFGGKLTPYEEDAKRRRDQERFQAKMERERGGR